MSYEFRPAVTSEAKPLVGIYSESGCGKTKSALLLAKGFTDLMGKVGMIETESGRGEVYAADPVVGGYRVLPVREDFSPYVYGKAITAAEKANLAVLIVDSASHEWEGVGGVLAMAAANQAAGKKGPLVWQEPKIAHGREFILRLLQTPIPLVIVCMRAKYPMVQVTSEFAKTHTGAKVGEWARDTALSPKQSDDILFEMMVHGWIDAAHAWHGTKYTTDELRRVFRDGEPITVETGKRLAEWAAGRPVQAAAQAAKPAQAPATEADRAKRVTVQLKRVIAASPQGWTPSQALTLLTGHPAANRAELTDEDIAKLEGWTDQQIAAELAEAAKE